MNLCVTDIGDIPVAGPVESYGSGAVRSCSPVGRCVLSTEAGELVPQYSTDDLRRKTVQAIHFHENGNVRSLSLEEKTPVFTPAGIIPAEMITFYKSGHVKRVFPLNGKLSGYWAQEDEEALATPIALDTPAGPISVKLISICFYESGDLRSVTLWPGEIVTVGTPAGSLKVRTGMSFRQDGSLISVEPAVPVQVKTPAGTVTCYDPDAVGIHGDTNSLVFDCSGNVTRLVTTLTSITATHYSGRKAAFIPESRDSLCGDGDKEMVPMLVSFEAGGMTIQSNPKIAGVYIDFDEYEVRTDPFLPQLGNMLGGLKCSV
ncbi:hypothetical protein [Maridesulfovibrio sp.]|uniref:hypothetical protein n=1 Tax=Maridesulfovibrio sp. TaxID=2795000 RepID=UPI002A187E8D|nr:hypothetical protein [Maridesulfovibrio sp.]